MYATQLYSQTVPLSMGRSREKAVGSDRGTEAKHIHQSHSDTMIHLTTRLTTGL